MTIYTRKGDTGETGLLDGSRVPKDDPRIEAVGSLDELNSSIGLARAFVADKAVDAILEGIQRDLFSIGSAAADPGRKKIKVMDRSISNFEGLIDRYSADLPPLREFILPGGTKSSALLHVARAACRRAERRIVAISGEGKTHPVVVKYMNRLSDLLFVMARVENKSGTERKAGS